MSSEHAHCDSRREDLTEERERLATKLWDAMNTMHILNLDYVKVAEERDRLRAALENLMNRMEAYEVVAEFPSLYKDVLAARKVLGEA